MFGFSFIRLCETEGRSSEDGWAAILRLAAERWRPRATRRLVHMTRVRVLAIIQNFRKKDLSNWGRWGKDDEIGAHLMSSG
jgi:hypothetical protein